MDGPVVLPCGQDGEKGAWLAETGSDKKVSPVKAVSDDK